MYRRYGKRCLDLLGALLLGAVALPVVGIAALMIRLESPGSAFFRQRRAGKGVRIFTIYKLRTMRTETERDGRTLGDVERVTRLGRVFRKLSVDELPQIWNVLKGDMSFIGPRPLPQRYVPYYTAEENRRHEVLPGISGWAQVNGRNALRWEERFALDVFYVDHVSPRLDAKIVWKTIGKVLRAEKVMMREESALPDFDAERRQGHGQADELG